MKDKFVNSSIKFIMKYQECDDLKLKKLNYGLQGIYSLVVKLTVIIIISIIINFYKIKHVFSCWFIIKKYNI